MELSQFEVEAAAAGARLDAFLSHALGVSRAEARRLLARGLVSVSGRRRGAAEKGERLAAGARVAVEPFLPAAERRPLPEPSLALPVLAEGPGWLVVDKPAGMPVHPLREDERGSALGFVAARHPEIVGVGEGGLRSGVVHRLDVETSGCLAFAYREEAWQRLRAAFRGHRDGEGATAPSPSAASRAAAASSSSWWWRSTGRRGCASARAGTPSSSPGTPSRRCAARPSSRCAR